MSADDLLRNNCPWTLRGLGGSDRQQETGDGWERSPETSESDGPFVWRGHWGTSRGNCFVAERCCLLVLNRTYAEPVTPLGRQRDSAAAVRRSPCSPGEQRDSRLTGVERHPAAVSNTAACPQRSVPSSPALQLEVVLEERSHPAAGSTGAPQWVRCS